MTCWKVETRDGKLFVGNKALEKATAGARLRENAGERRDRGRRGSRERRGRNVAPEGYRGGLTLLSADGSIPYDRPALSKDFLNGTAAGELVPLRSTDFYKKHEIEHLLKTPVAAVDPRSKAVQLADGKQHEFDALLLATGAEPVKLKVPSADLAHVCYLRSQSDCRAIIAKAAKAKYIVLVGASFIAMEVPSSLIQQKLEVHIVAPEEVPMATVLGPQVGAHLRRLHERNGAVFHLQQSVVAMDERKVTLKDGRTINADLGVIGIGVKPLIDHRYRTQNQ